MAPSGVTPGELHHPGGGLVYAEVKGRLRHGRNLGFGGRRKSWKAARMHQTTQGTRAILPVGVQEHCIRCVEGHI